MEISFIPKYLLQFFSSKFVIQHQLNILLSNILVLLLFLIFKNKLIEYLNLIPHFCLFDSLLGVQCPVCGTTRAFCEISSGNFKNAYHLNFSSFFVLFYFFAQIPFRIIALKNNNFITSINSISQKLGFALIGIILINWIFNLIILKM